jgi:ABC-2 type transport system ATP-binding protein
MTGSETPAKPPVVAASALVKSFGPVDALDRLDLAVPAGLLMGLVGPDGAGKTTLMRLCAGLMSPTSGELKVLGETMPGGAGDVQKRLGYMPQRFGLYEDLTVSENLDLYAELRAVPAEGRAARLEDLLRFTDLARFRTRLAGALSGGMKQKLGLACALVGSPDLLLLDEPSVGVDPLSRRELFAMVRKLLDQGVTVMWSTAYLDEAERCDRVLVLNAGKTLDDGPPAAFRDGVAGRTFQVAAPPGAAKRKRAADLWRVPGVKDVSIQGASIRLLTEGPLASPPPEGWPADAKPVPPRFEDAFIAALPTQRFQPDAEEEGAAGRLAGTEAAIEARDLVKRFGSFAAVDGVSFSVGRGEVFGLLGPNGAGKSTTFRMLCGLLTPTAGTAKVAGVDLIAAPAFARARLGYMSQKFSLYGDLTPQQNLRFFAGAYGMAAAKRDKRVAALSEEFELGAYARERSADLPLGFKQRLALAAAILHDPEILFLDEPTSGVDPLTRREFWRRIDAMAMRGVTVLVTSHFMDEAEYCDRLILIYRGKAIAEGTPDTLKQQTATPDHPDPSLEDAFIAIVEDWDRRHAA